MGKGRAEAGAADSSGNVHGNGSGNGNFKGNGYFSGNANVNSKPRRTRSTRTDAKTAEGIFDGLIRSRPGEIERFLEKTNPRRVS